MKKKDDRPPAWLLYRFWDADGNLLYVGQTGRIAMARWLEHIRDQWWAEEIATMHVAPTRYASQAAVLAAERLAIATEWPRYNDKHNRGNPHRVVGPPRQTRRSQPAQPQPPLPRPRKRPARALFVGLAVVWIALAAYLWWMPALAGDPGPLDVRVILSLGGASVLTYAIADWRPIRRRLWAHRR